MKSPGSHSPNTGISGKHLAVGLLVLAGCLASPLSVAQDRYLFQGIFDAELHDTNADSPLLTRNDGNLAALGRLQLWTAFQLSRSLQLYAQGELESSNFEGSRETQTDLDQIALRYTRQSAPWLLAEAGKILSPLAAYSERRLSTRNPLIGQPYLYTTGYPWGAKVAGAAGWFDYQVAWIDPSGSDPDYQIIEPDSAYRPALGAGVTPLTGLRLGLSWTRGPYLSRQSNGHLPGGGSWRDYDQRVVGLDFQFSRGYLEFNGQLLRTQHEVPSHSRVPEDSSFYLELKYTWTPRLYGAIRYQGVEVTTVGYPEYNRWRAETLKFKALEAGFGYRFSPDVLFKIAYQSDHWDDSGYGYSSNARGHALGLQLSWFFDLVSLLSERP